MLDKDMNVYLIEINSNPCLELAGPYLTELLPNVIEDMVQIAVDPIFNEPEPKDGYADYLRERGGSRCAERKKKAKGKNRFVKIFP